MAGFLQDTFSQRVAALIAGVDDPKQVGRWARQQNTPRIDSENRMLAACQVFAFIAHCENVHIARAWMMGMNPQLEDDSPSRQSLRDASRKSWARHDPSSAVICEPFLTSLGPASPSGDCQPLARYPSQAVDANTTVAAPGAEPITPATCYQRL
ncbi:hypothetical protein NKH18_28765 [Streptomyces sp. M10(2022)]